MDEYNRILIEEYCRSHNSKKSRRLQELVYRSYDVDCDAYDEDFIFLEKCINSEKDEKLKAALEDLKCFLAGWW